MVKGDFSADIHKKISIYGVSLQNYVRKYYGHHNKANLRDLRAETGLVMLLKFDLHHRFCSQCDLEIWRMTSKNYRPPHLYYTKRYATFQIHWWIQTVVTVRKRSIRVKMAIYCPLENNRAPLLYHIKLCASFESHGWIWTGVTVQKHSILVKIGNLLCCVTKMWWMTLGNRAHLF